MRPTINDIKDWMAQTEGKGDVARRDHVMILLGELDPKAPHKVLDKHPSNTVNNLTTREVTMNWRQIRRGDSFSVSPGQMVRWETIDGPAREAVVILRLDRLEGGRFVVRDIAVPHVESVYAYDIIAVEQTPPPKNKTCPYCGVTVPETDPCTLPADYCAHDMTYPYL
jgi:hypothetical protein